MWLAPGRPSFSLCIFNRKCWSYPWNIKIIDHGQPRQQPPPSNISKSIKASLAQLDKSEDCIKNGTTSKIVNRVLPTFDSRLQRTCPLKKCWALCSQDVKHKAMQAHGSYCNGIWSTWISQRYQKQYHCKSIKSQQRGIIQEVWCCSKQQKHRFILFYRRRYTTCQLQSPLQKLIFRHKRIGPFIIAWHGYETTHLCVESLISFRGILLDAKSSMWRNVKLVECLLEPELRKDFKQQNPQLTHLELDAKCVANHFGRRLQTYNWQKQFKSRLFIENYRSLFNKQKEPPAVSFDLTMDLESFKKKVNTLHGYVSRAYCETFLSGGGDDLNAYANLAFKFEGELHDFTTTLNSSASTTMTNTVCYWHWRE